MKERIYKRFITDYGVTYIDISSIEAIEIYEGKVYFNMDSGITNSIDGSMEEVVKIIKGTVSFNGGYIDIQE